MDEMIELQETYIEPEFDSQAIVDKFRDFRDRSKKQFDGNYSTMREHSSTGRHSGTARTRSSSSVPGTARR